MVQALPSLHVLVLFVVDAQPWPGSQESSVQGWLSSQWVVGPPLQSPPPQVSPVVQAFPSLHGLVLFV